MEKLLTRGDYRRPADQVFKQWPQPPLMLLAADRGVSMTTLLIGADGQLGSEFRQLFDEGDLVPLTHAELELTNPLQIWYTDSA